MHTSTQRGYTLLELSIVIGIIAVMIGVILAPVNINIARKKNQETAARLDAVEQALRNFRSQNNRLPCPAGFTDLQSSSTYGVNSTPAGTCTAAAAGTCNGAAPIVCNWSSAGSTTIAGAVPVRLLGLPDEAMFDAWGRRITYIVDPKATETNAFTTYSITSTAVGFMLVKKIDGTNITDRALAVLISYGPNGHGAYTRSGTRLNTGATGAWEVSNARYNSSGAYSNVANAFYQMDQFSSASYANQFDDIVRFYNRESFPSITDLQP